MGKESKGWSLIEKLILVVPIKITGPDRGPDCNILFSTFFGVKFSFSSLTS
jgi:hypothetical protein